MPIYMYFSMFFLGFLIIPIQSIYCNTLFSTDIGANDVLSADLGRAPNLFQT